MAHLAALLQVLAYLQTLLRIIGTLDVMHTVAIEAHRLVGLSIWRLFFEQGYGRTVKIGNICFEDICGDVVFSHQVFVRMALCTKQRRLQAECGCARIFDIVHSMTVNARWHVRIAFIDQCTAMHTREIFLINRAVAQRASAGNPGPGFWQQLSCFRIG